jgi:hypothetical protein
MREAARERLRHAALTEARDQLEQRARGAHRLGAQQLVAQIRETRGVPVADLVIEVAEIEAAGADPSISASR